MSNSHKPLLPSPSCYRCRSPLLRLLSPSPLPWRVALALAVALKLSFRAQRRIPHSFRPSPPLPSSFLPSAFAALIVVAVALAVACCPCLSRGPKVVILSAAKNPSFFSPSPSLPSSFLPSAFAVLIVVAVALALACCRCLSRVFVCLFSVEALKSRVTRPCAARSSARSSTPRTRTHSSIVLNCRF